MDPKESKKRAIMAIRASFVNELGQRIDLIRRRWDDFKNNPSDKAVFEELTRLVHNLSGTSTTMGFTGVGSCAAILDGMLRTVPENSEDFDLLTLEIQNLALCVSNVVPPVFEEEKAKVCEDVIEPECDPVPSIGRVIFHLDADVEFLQEISRKVERFDYKVQRFRSLGEFERALADEIPGVIIADLAFVDELSALKKSRGLKAPLLLISKSGDFDSRLKVVRAGGAGFYLKPVAIKDLLDQLEEIFSDKASAPLRVLVIDDDKSFANFEAATLAEWGIITRPVADPRHVLDALGEFQPDLILLDLYMPACKGYELARIIRQIPAYVSLPIVFLSHEEDRTLQIDALSSGGDDFLIKPVKPADLRAVVTVRARRMKLMRSLMERDGLTGLYNHSTTKELLSQTVELAKRQNAKLSFVMFDLDKFKDINDFYGHYVGDSVLIVFTRLLEKRLRKTDIIGRYGGEEFAAILFDTTPEDAMEIIDAVRESFKDLPHESEKGPFTVSFSYGIAGFPEFFDAMQLIVAADKALYSAKKTGRNKGVIATMEMLEGN